MYQSEKRLFPPESERWFVSTNGIRPCAPLLPRLVQFAPASSDSYRLVSAATTKRTYDSSGEAAIEHWPSGMPAPASTVHVVPLSVERRWPSSPQASTVPPLWATTSQTSLAEVAGVGSTNVHVAPESVLLATPQSVPTKTLFAASGRIEMPNANGSVVRAFEQL